MGVAREQRGIQAESTTRLTDIQLATVDGTVRSFVAVRIGQAIDAMAVGLFANTSASSAVSIGPALGAANAIYAHLIDVAISIARTFNAETYLWVADASGLTLPSDRAWSEWQTSAPAAQLVFFAVRRRAAIDANEALSITQLSAYDASAVGRTRSGLLRTLVGSSH